MNKKILLLNVLLIFMMACTMQTKKPNPAIDLANMDLNVEPGSDFYRYANGNWLKNNPIPDEMVEYGAFVGLQENTKAQLKAIIEEVSKDKKAAQGSIAQKIRDFYNSGMDTARINSLGIDPVKEELAMINNMSNTNDLLQLTAYFQQHYLKSLFYSFSGADAKNSSFVVLYLAQGGISLPDVDYYRSEDARSKEIREEYMRHIARIFTLAGDTEKDALKQAKTIMDIETRLANASMTRLERRDPLKTYNKMDIADIQKLAKNINWQDYFKCITLENPGEFVVRQPNFFKELSTMLAEISMEDWKTYMKWKLLDSSAGYLSADFEKADFDFYNTFLSGQQEMQPRWKRVTSATDNNLGEALGQLYVKKHFPEQAKIRMQKLVENLKLAMQERIKNLDWMMEETKEKALEKLAKMSVQIGYPDKWKDYSKLEIVPNKYFQNIKNASHFMFTREMAKVGKPLDKSDWYWPPQTVNAGYMPTYNEINFPAGILQPPFFYLDADDAVNYGAIGVVIGHEMTHGFDDQGGKYDLAGNLKNWWAAEDAEKFKEKSQVLVEQFNNFAILDSLHVDGALTLGENIADLGGLSISFDALQKALEENPTENIDGFSPAQRFFLSYAQIWRRNIRDKDLMRKLKEDVHSPAEARVNGAVVNADAFQEAFNLKEGDKLYLPKEKRAKIW